MRFRKFVYPALCSVALIFGFACSPMSAMDDASSNSASSVGFTFAAALSQITTNESIQMTATGGYSPYTYSVLGDGTVSSTGVYTAPASIPTSTETVTVSAEDSSGEVRTYSMTVVQSSSLSSTISPSNPGVLTLVTITPTGGVAPYTYVIASGSGSLSGNTYTTSSVAETASVKFTDSSGQIGYANISSGGSAGSVPLSAVTMTPEGTHTPGGGGCSASSFSLGEIVDAGGGNPYGDQIFCGTNGTTLSSSTVITNFYVTTGGSHISGGYACPSGYSRLGSVADCQGGTCSGDQNICIATGKYGTASQVVYDIYITQEGARSIAAPVCNTGFTSVGQVADCANGQCYGLQSICVEY